MKHIDWDYPAKVDLAFGAGANRWEKFLAYLGGFLVPASVLFRYNDLQWSIGQYLLAVLIGMDIGAGAVANSLNSCKRFYHTPRRQTESRLVGWLKNKFFFSALHIYPLVVSLVWGNSTRWGYGLIWYFALVSASWVILKIPLYLKRPAAILILIAVVILNGPVIPPITGFEWLAPLLFMKIILGHLVPEEPYRP